MWKRNPLALFFPLAFLLSWYPWIIALARGKTSGPNPLGPLVAAIVVTAVVSGRAGLKSFFASLVRWRVGLGWYVLVFLLPIAVCALAAGGAVLAGAHAAPLTQLPSAKELPERFIFILLFIGLGEEPGWRGFAIPHLQRRFSPLAASFVLAPIWALWHLPLFGTEFPPRVVPAFLVGIVADTVFQTWLLNRTRGSVLVQMLFHAAVNTIGAGFVFTLFAGDALVTLWWIYAGVWVAIAVGVAIGGRMATRRAAEDTTISARVNRPLPDTPPQP